MKRFKSEHAERQVHRILDYVSAGGTAVLTTLHRDLVMATCSVRDAKDIIFGVRVYCEPCERPGKALASVDNLTGTASYVVNVTGGYALRLVVPWQQPRSEVVKRLARATRLLAKMTSKLPPPSPSGGAAPAQALAIPPLRHANTGKLVHPIHPTKYAAHHDHCARRRKQSVPHMR